MDVHIRTAERADIPALLDLIHNPIADHACGGWTHEADLLGAHQCREHSFVPSGALRAN